MTIESEIKRKILNSLIISKVLRNIVVAVLILLCWFFLIFLTSLSTQSEKIGLSGIYHYFIGAKYFNEIGYFNLYTCTLAADQQSLKKLSSLRIIRDLRSYELKEVNLLPVCPVKRFSSSRWKTFVEDISYFVEKGSPNYWAAVFLDKGYNPPPFWAVTAGVIASSIDVHSKIMWTLIFNIDLLFMILAVVVIIKTSTKKYGVITALLICFYFGTFKRLGWNFFQYGWFTLLAYSISLWIRKKYAMSGILLGLSAGLQAFPALLCIPIILSFLIDLSRRKFQNAKVERQFLIFFGITLYCCLMIGSFTSRGFSGWTDWQRKISLHKTYVNAELFNIGLPNLIATTFTLSDEDVSSYFDDYPLTIGRLVMFERLKYVWVGIVVVLLTLTSVGLYMSKKGSLFVFSLIPLYAVTSLSPFYYILLALIPFMSLTEKVKTQQCIMYSTLALFLIQLVLSWKNGYTVFNYKLHLVSEVLLTCYVLWILSLLLTQKYIERSRQ